MQPRVITPPTLPTAVAANYDLMPAKNDVPLRDPLSNLVAMDGARARVHELKPSKFLT